MISMEWVELAIEKPKQKQDCIVLDGNGAVTRAIAHNEWIGGFCCGDGKSGFGVPGVTHWMKFKRPAR